MLREFELVALSCLSTPEYSPSQTSKEEGDSSENFIYRLAHLGLFLKTYQENFENAGNAPSEISQSYIAELSKVLQDFSTRH